MKICRPINKNWPMAQEKKEHLLYFQILFVFAVWV